MAFGLSLTCLNNPILIKDQINTPQEFSPFIRLNNHCRRIIDAIRPNFRLAQLRMCMSTYDKINPFNGICNGLVSSIPQMGQCDNVLKPLLLHETYCLFCRFLSILKSYFFPRAGSFSGILRRHAEYTNLNTVYIQNNIRIYTRICGCFRCCCVNRYRTFH
ncbi:hypothetical protein D3C81_1308160 [compost metagenome]